MLLLDSHILLFLVANRLQPAERQALRNTSWSIPSIVLWEIGFLFREGRIRISLNDPTLNRLLSRMTVWELDRRVALALSDLDFRSDPADEIIAATAIAHDIPLLTRDMRLLGSKVVPLALR